MRFTTETIITCYHHYLHITFIITKVLKLLNKFAYKHTYTSISELSPRPKRRCCKSETLLTYPSHTVL